jgi:hypothetical protein
MKAHPQACAAARLALVELIEEGEIAAQLCRVKAGVNVAHRSGGPLRDRGMRRQRDSVTGGGLGDVAPIGVGGAHDIAGGLGWAPPGLIGAGGIAAHAQAAVTP